MKKMKTCLLFLCGWISFQAALAADIVIDAGHGGKDPGASRKYKGKLYREKDFTLAMSKQLQRDFKDKGYSVAMTRNADKTVSLRERLYYAREHCKKLFVSIHVDSAPTPRASGVNAFAAGKNHEMGLRSMRIARNVQNAFSPIRQVRTEKFFVLNNSNCPTLLVEMGYITNDRDLNRLIDPKERNKMVGKLGNVLHQSIKPQPKKVSQPAKNKETKPEIKQNKKAETPKPETQSHKNKKAETKSDKKTLGRQI